MEKIVYRYGSRQVYPNNKVVDTFKTLKLEMTTAVIAENVESFPA